MVCLKHYDVISFFDADELEDLELQQVLADLAQTHFADDLVGIEKTIELNRQLSRQQSQVARLHSRKERLTSEDKPGKFKATITRGTLIEEEYTDANRV
jgi:hypothetical protein